MMQSTFRKLVDSARYFESILWDMWMNVDTSHRNVTIKEQLGKHGDSFGFETNAHHTVRNAIRLVRPTADDTVVVIGSAKGRAVCHFARLRVKKVIGIELSPELAAIAQKNAMKLRGRKAPISIRNVDAAVADFSEGTIFYMFNPFGEKTLHSVLSKIELCHRMDRKPLTIIYSYPKFSSVFDRFPYLEKKHDVTSFAGLRTVVYKTH